MAVKIELTVPEVNTILRSLGKHPFDEINVLIEKIKKQGDEQVALNQAAKQAATDETPEATPAE